MKYQKIDSLYKRDDRGKFVDEYSNEIFYYLKDLVWIGTEKIDGTNIRVYWDGQNVTFKGRTDKAQIPPSLTKRLTEIFVIDRMYDNFRGNDVILYGEGYGNKIQKGSKYLKDSVNFILFDVFIDGIFLSRLSLIDISLKLDIPTVPLAWKGSLVDAENYVKSGFPSKIGKCQAEGLVLKPKFELFDRLGNRVITKIKTKDYV